MARKRNQPVLQEVEAEFSRLFWAARREQIRLKEKTTADDPEQKAARALARAQGWTWAEALLDASRLDWTGAHDKALVLLTECGPSIPQRWHGLFHFVRGAALDSQGAYDEAIQAYRKALEDPKFDAPGHAWNNLGNALLAKGEHDEAIHACRKALEDPRLDPPGDAWYNLGIALFAKGEHDEAIQAFRKALGDPKFDPPGDAWYNLGNALRAKGEHDEAIQAYRKALDDPKFDRPGQAWNNLGIALLAKGEHDEAIQAYRKALDDPRLDPPGYAWNNLGIALAAKGEHGEAIKAYRKVLNDPRYDRPAKAWTDLAQTYVAMAKRKQAEEAFKKALESPDPKGEDHARARLGLQVLKAEIETDALSPDDRAMAAKPASEAQTDEMESGVIAAIREAGDTQYERYIAKPGSKRDNTLSILRGWCSAVTLLEGSARRWRGGGYFLKWRGHGIVLDPGFDFLRNFHDAGYHGREIDAVVVSHNHSDHNNDLKAIDDLRYQLFLRLAATKKAGSLPYVLLWDQDTNEATTFGIEKPLHHHEPVVLPSGFPQPINLQEHAAKIPVRLTPFKVSHASEVPHAMGMLLELLDKKGKPVQRIGYTADTAYFPGLPQHLRDCDVLIAHISQPTIEELQDAAKLKDVHLGYRGTARLLKECKPKLALIGEFWAGFTDLRIALVKGLRQRSGVEAILPAGLGMHLRLPSLDIECTQCAKPTSFLQVKIAPPAETFGSLAYLCPQCMIG